MNGSGLVGDVQRLFQSLDHAEGVVFAVSGGPDSIAMMHLASRWRPPERSMRLRVATVDHGLQTGSDEVAARVVAAAEGMGFAARTLIWTGEKPRRAIQEKAREARYVLLDGFAKDVGASHLVTAHTLDDQAETLLFRAARGSGLAGLGGMRAAGDRNGLRHIRPFLQVRKQVLSDLCAQHGWPVENDPANIDPQFSRARWRRLAPALAAEGLTPERLGRLAERLQRADAALRIIAGQTAVRCAAGERPGLRRFHADTLMDQPDDIVARVIASALMEVGEHGPLRLNRLETLVSHLRECHAGGNPLKRTLRHCIIALDRTGLLTIGREGDRRRGLPRTILPVQSP